jgi:hypothetical protein
MVSYAEAHTLVDAHKQSDRVSKRIDFFLTATYLWKARLILGL